MAEDASEHPGTDIETEAQQLAEARLMLDEIANRIREKFGTVAPLRGADRDHSKQFQEYDALERQWEARADALDERLRASTGPADAAGGAGPEAIAGEQSLSDLEREHEEVSRDGEALSEMAQAIEDGFGTLEPPEGTEPDSPHARAYEKYLNADRAWYQRLMSYQDKRRAMNGGVDPEPEEEILAAGEDDDDGPDDDTGLDGAGAVASLSGATQPRQAAPPPPDDDAAREAAAERQRRTLGAEADRPPQGGRRNRPDGHNNRTDVPPPVPPASPPGGTIVTSSEGEFSETVMSRRRGVVCTDKEIRIYKPVRKLTPADLDHILKHVMKMGWVELYASNKLGGTDPVLRHVLNAHIHSKFDAKKARGGTDKAFRSYCQQCHGTHGCMCHVSHKNTPPDMLPLHVQKKELQAQRKRAAARAPAADDHDHPPRQPNPRADFSNGADPGNGSGRDQAQRQAGPQGGNQGAGGGRRSWWGRGGEAPAGGASFGTGESGGTDAHPRHGDNADPAADTRRPQWQFRYNADGSFTPRPEADPAADATQARAGGRTGRGGPPPPPPPGSTPT